MLEGGKISSRQAIWLLSITILSTAILFLPSISAEIAAQDAWISVLVATAWGIVMSLLLAALMMRFPRHTIVEYSEIIAGRLPGKLLGLGYTWYFLHVNAIIIREFGELLVSVFLPQTPVIVFNVMIIILAAVAVRSGLEPLGRLNEWLFILIVTILFFLLALNAPLINMANLQPVLERGWSPVLKGAAHPAAWLGEIILLAMIFPFLSRPQEGYRIVIWINLIVGGCLLASLLVALTVLSPELSGRFTFPIVELARMVTLGEFFERIEALVMVIWVGGTFVKISLFHYATVMAAAQWFKLGDYRPLVIPLGTLAAILSDSLFPDVTGLLFFLGATFPPYAISTFQGGIPLLLLALALLRGKKDQENSP